MEEEPQSGKGTSRIPVDKCRNGRSKVGIQAADCSGPVPVLRLSPQEMPKGRKGGIRQGKPGKNRHQFPPFPFPHSLFPEEKLRSGPVSRVLSRVIISLGRGLLRRLDATDPAVGRSGPPRSPERSCLLGLAPGGVYPAGTVTSSAVRSYRTFSPLPVFDTRTPKNSAANHRRSVFCGTFPVLTDGGRYPPPCPVEPGLSSLAEKQERSPDPLRS